MATIDDMTRGAQIAAQRDALAGRLFDAVLGAMDLCTLYLGDRLGLYRALRELDEATPAALAAAAGLDARYVREWAEQQAVTGILEVATPSADDDERTYRLPPGHAAALLDEHSLAFAAPLGALTVGAVGALDAVARAFATGEGVPFARYGADVRHGQAALNRPVFTQLLVDEYLPSLTDVHARLHGGPARILDLGCGAGWSAIAMAAAYRQVTIDGVDSDEASVAEARATARAEGVADRVRITAGDAAAPPPGPYALVTILEALHDMAHPVETLAAARAQLEPGGCVLVMDPRVAEEFTAPADPVERFMYGASVLHCLPVGRSQPGSAATGTVLRPSLLRAYAEAAGFAVTTVLPLDHDVFRFYRLDP